MKQIKMKVNANAVWTDMTPESYGTPIAAEHRGEVGTVVGSTDAGYDLVFDDGSYASYKRDDVSEFA